MGATIYARALKAGQKEYKVFLSRQEDPWLDALESRIPTGGIAGEEDLGLQSIPMELIAGTRNTARRDCFSPTFLPLLDENSEFAGKWAALAEAHLGLMAWEIVVQIIHLIGLSVRLILWEKNGIYRLKMGED